MEKTQQSIPSKFPITSQTSDADKLFLLKTIETVMSKEPSFKYIEVGSFMGGSLTPFLMERACSLVASIDERGQHSPDERGAKFDYSKITSKSMIDKLVSHGLDISKLIIHDGTVKTFDCDNHSFDIAFIDGEHTDVACVRDFIWIYPKMKKSSIILFHDSTIVYKGLSIIVELLEKKEIQFKVVKDQRSEISAAFIGGYADMSHREIFGDSEDWKQFQNRSEIAMLRSVISNRVGFEINYKINPTPIRPAY
jgi:hypothetical protein